MKQKDNKQDPNHTPYGAHFDRAQIYDYYLLGSSLVTLAISAINVFLDIGQTLFLSLFLLQVVVAFLSFLIKYLQVDELSQAYEKKRKCELDDAFGSKLSPNIVVGYFDLGNMEPGYKRLLGLTHENAFFTHKNSSVYNKRIGILGAIFLIILFIVVYQGSHANNFSLSFLNFVMISLFSERIFSSKKLSDGCKTINDECISIITSWDAETSYIRVIDIFVSYSNLLSATKVNIDPSVHLKFMAENNNEWNEIFNRYYSSNE